MKNLKEIKEMVEDLKKQYLNAGFVSALEFDNLMEVEGFYGSLFDDSGNFDSGIFNYQNIDEPSSNENEIIEVTIYFDNVKGDDEEPRTVLMKIYDIQIDIN